MRHKGTTKEFWCLVDGALPGARPSQAQLWEVAETIARMRGYIASDEGLPPGTTFSLHKGVLTVNMPCGAAQGDRSCSDCDFDSSSDEALAKFARLLAGVKL